MDFTTAIEHCLDGNAVLFVGAGFSKGAKNRRGSALKTGKGLAEELCRQCGIPEMDLNYAASWYENQKGEDSLKKLLFDEFLVQSVSSDQIFIGTIPWSRIYTTNYDNVIETVYESNKLQITPVDLRDAVSKVKGDHLCVHINGYIKNIYNDNLRDTLRLTQESYDADSIVDSEWISLFRKDISLAKVVVFIGYGLNNLDLDLRRILYKHTEIFEKTFFITSKKITPQETIMLKDYGTIKAIGLEGFIKEIDSTKLLYKPLIDSKKTGLSFVEYEISNQLMKTTNISLHALFVYGVIEKELIKNRDYFIKRESAKQILQFVRCKENVVLYSDIGDGKTICLQQFCELACQERYRVFFLNSINCDTAKEFHIIKQLSAENSCVIIIDSFADIYEDISAILKTKNDNIFFVFSCRTPSYEVYGPKVLRDFPDTANINITRLKDNEIKELVCRLKSSGLIGKYAANKEADLIKLFSGKKCNSHFSSILLDIFRQPEVSERILKEYKLIQDKPKQRILIITAYILSIIDNTNIFNRLETIWGIEFLSNCLPKDPSMMHFIDYRSNAISTVSSSFSRFILENEDPSFLLDLLTKLFLRIYKIKQLNRLKKDLMNYDKIRRIFSSTQKGEMFLTYYNNIADVCHDNVFFWLQYAICSMNNGHFDLANQYFETSYSLAKKLPNWNSFQIDNSFEKFLLLRALHSHSFNDAWKDFSSAHSMIISDLTNQSDDILKFYPYRNIKDYEDFYNTYVSDIHKNEDILKSFFSKLVFLKKIIILSISVVSICNNLSSFVC